MSNLKNSTCFTVNVIAFFLGCNSLTIIVDLKACFYRSCHTLSYRAGFYKL